jgi:hypothetical protein
MVEDQFMDIRSFSDPADFTNVGVKGGHALQVRLAEAVPPEIAEVCHLVNEDVGTLGQSDQSFIRGGVARKHDRAVRGVKAVRQSWDCSAVHDPDRGDPDGFVLHDHDWSLRDALRPRRGGDVEPRTSSPASGMRASRGMTFRW